MFHDKVTRTITPVLKSVFLTDIFVDSIMDVGGLRNTQFEQECLFDGRFDFESRDTAVYTSSGV